jgi:glyoxylase-like metal-dependent hydrolase (beta-lactamase superfamily II)
MQRVELRAAGAGSTAPSSGTAPGAESPSGAPTASGSASGSELAWRQVPLTIVSAYLLIRGEEVAVVDTGTSGSAHAIADGLTAVGVGWGAVRHVVLTHKHPDHVGGLTSVVPLATAAAIHAGTADVADIPTTGRQLLTVRDGTEVFGLRIVSTPGHTAGHVSVFDPATGVLVAGDALRTTNGLQGSDPAFTDDAQAAATSVRKLAALDDVRVILPGHGQPLTAGAAHALRKLAASLPSS